MTELKRQIMSQIRATGPITLAEYIHRVMEDVLGETHGVMVYQEQVMRILNRLGGIELVLLKIL